MFRIKDVICVLDRALQAASRFRVLVGGVVDMHEGRDNRFHSSSLKRRDMGTTRISPACKVSEPEMERRSDPLMKILTAAAVLLLLPAQAYADLISLSGMASVSASGEARSGAILGGAGDSYSQTQSVLAPFATFNGSASGVATWTIPPDPSYTLPTTFSASSQAVQNSTFATDGISISGDLSAQHSANVGFPFAFTSSSATSVFDVIFAVDEPMAYALALNVMGQDGHGFTMFISAPVFSLTQVGGGLSLDTSDLLTPSRGTWSYTGTGLLSPGNYHLVFDLNAAPVGNDPLGDFQTKDFSLGLQVSDVPDTGTTVVLFGLSLAVIFGLRRFRAAA
jgi:hypothetical protein